MVARKRAAKSASKSIETKPVISSQSSDASTDSSHQKSESSIDGKSKAHSYKHGLVHSYPVHVQCAPSCLSGNSNDQNFWGFMNLAALLLFVSNIRLIVENYLKYGILLSNPAKYISGLDWVCFLILLPLSPLHIAIALEIEKVYKVDRTMNEKMRAALDSRARAWHILNTLASVVIPCLVVYYLMDHPLPGTLSITISCITTLKVYSFFSCNRELASISCEDNQSSDSDSSKESSSSLKPFTQLQYPQNLTYSNIFYFYVAPTLCYQTSYPRTEKVRKLFLTKRLVELVAAQFIMYLLIEQYAKPTVKNSLKAFDELHWGAIAERVLKLSITSIYVWLIMFYSLFHSLLNAIAEVTQFGDREFYLPWWNSSTLSQYWRLWNQPVHRYIKRHVHIPLRSRGYSSFFCLLVAFFISAVFHEILVAIPVHVTDQYLAFFGMMGQVPLVFATEFLEKWRYQWYKKYRGIRQEDGRVEVNMPKNSLIGNLVFWISFCIVGQPFSVLLYYRAWFRNQM